MQIQPTCYEVEDEFWAQAQLNDLFAWDPSVEHSPTEKE